MSNLIYLPLLIAAVLPWSPQAGDIDLIRGEAFVVYRDEQVIEGWLPTPCHELRIDGDDVYSVLEPGLNCLQTLTWFEAQIGGLP